MAKGKSRIMYLGSAGCIENPYSNLDFLYQASTTKMSNFNVGDGIDVGGLRRFRYAKAGGTITYTQMGVGNPLVTIPVAVAPAQATGAGAVGSYTVTFTKAATAGVAGDGVIAADELRGGYVVVGNGSGQIPQCRGILGNPASAAGAASLTITLDAALIAAVTVATTTIEVSPNPYSYLTYCSADYATMMGIPCVPATAGQYFWVQTRGPVWLTSNSVTCDSAGDRTIVFVGNNSVVSSNDITVESGIQIAGKAIDASSSGSSNAPFINLTLE